MEKKLCVVSIPFTLGSHRRGSDLGPKSIIYAGLIQRLQEKKYAISEKEINVSHKEDLENHSLKNLSAVLETCNTISNTIDKVLEGNEIPLVLGGDHSISIGTIAGIAKKYEHLGVIWVDAHGDVNTDLTTLTGTIHGMPLAVNMGIGSDLLTGIHHFSPKVKPENVVLIGVRDLDAGEVELLKKYSIMYYTNHDIEQEGIGWVMERVKEKFNTNGVKDIHLSFDLDALDPTLAKGVGTPVSGGLTYRESSYILQTIKKWDQLVSAEFVEVNPLFDDCNQTAEITVSLINELF